MWQTVLGSTWHNVRCFRLPRQRVSHSPEVSQLTAELVLSHWIALEHHPFYSFHVFLKVVYCFFHTGTGTDAKSKCSWNIMQSLLDVLLKEPPACLASKGRMQRDGLGGNPHATLASRTFPMAPSCTQVGCPCATWWACCRGCGSRVYLRFAWFVMFFADASSKWNSLSRSSRTQEFVVFFQNHCM